MNLLLDTHVLVWVLENNKKLSRIARDAIIDGNNVIFISAVSAWEISVKQSMGVLSVPSNMIEEIRLHRFAELKVNFEHAQLAGSLPDIHQDPFDRMLVAQAKIEKLTLVSRDKIIEKYDVRYLRA